MKLLLAAAVLMLAGCGSLKSESRVSSPLQARQYNSVASSFMAGPTVVYVADMSDGARILRVMMDLYNGQQAALNFPAGASAPAIANIDKYLEWETMARGRGDALTKEIGRSRAWSSMGASTGAEIKMSMHSGNERNHYLVASFCAAGTCLENTGIYFDRPAAIELRRLLVQLDTGTLKATDASVYK